VPATSADILNDIVSTLRATGQFDQVALGKSDTASVVPRVCVTHEGEESFRPDDASSSQWGRLQARITVHTRSDDTHEATLRAVDLSNAAAQALLVDPYRDQRCQDLPIGMATEIGRCELSKIVRRPEVEATFYVRCHFESEEA